MNKAKREYTRTYRYLVPDASHDTWYCMSERKHGAAQKSTAPQGKARHGTRQRTALRCAAEL